MYDLIFSMSSQHPPIIVDTVCVCARTLVCIFECVCVCVYLHVFAVVECMCCKLCEYICCVYATNLLSVHISQWWGFME